jgi:hypothetical protein
MPHASLFGLGGDFAFELAPPDAPAKPFLAWVGILFLGENLFLGGTALQRRGEAKFKPLLFRRRPPIDTQPVVILL